jgi:hypothetical protein
MTPLVGLIAAGALGVEGTNVSYNLSEAERDILESARRLLGNSLGNFLLSGLGETEVTRRRTFAAWGVGHHAGSFTYEVEAVGDSEMGLPSGREPLVMAALLGLLQERQPPDGRVNFREGEVLDRLGWSARGDSRGVLKQALEKYLAAAYYLIDETLPREERLFGRYAGFRRLVISYETNSTIRPIHRINPPRMTGVQFLPEFITDVSSVRKYFLGVEFQKLGGIRRVDD